MESEGDVSTAVNDDKSPLIDLIRCAVCNETMKLEKSSPDAEGRDIIRYRCGLCNRIERMRLFRRSRDSIAWSEGQWRMLSVMQYPHWMMVAGAVLVVSGVIGYAFSRNRNREPGEGNEGEGEVNL
jgi:hypothetical protein